MPTRVDFDGPLCQENMDEPVYAHEKIVRDLAALALDRNLRFLSRAEAKLDRVIAKCFARLKQGTNLLDLGYVRFRDYIDECGSMSLRSAQEMVQLEEAVRAFPRIDAELDSGRLCKTKAMLLVRHAKAENENVWVERAIASSVRRLRDAIESDVAARESEAGAEGESDSRGGAGCECGAGSGESGACRGESGTGTCEGGACSSEGLAGSAEIGGAGAASASPEPPLPLDDEPTGSWLQVNVPPDVALLWDRCKEAVSRMLGFEASDAMALDLCMAEFLNGVGHRFRGGAPSGLTDDEREAARQAAREARERRAQVQRFLEDDTNGWAFLDKAIPVVELTEAIRAPEDSDDAWALQAKIQRAIRLRQRVRACMGRMLYTMANRGLHRDMQFASMGHYAVERLGMSARTCRAAVARQRGFFFFPEVRKAYEEGRIDQTRADLVMQVGGDFFERAWLAHAQRVTTLQLRLDVQAAKRLFEQSAQEQCAWGSGGVPTLADLEALLEEARQGESADGRLEHLADQLRKRHTATQGEAGEGSAEGTSDDPAGERHTSAQGKPDEPVRRPRLIPSGEAPCTLRMWLPDEIDVVWREVMAVCDRIVGRVGRDATTSEALEAVCLSFIRTWMHEIVQMEKTHPIQQRQGWRCAVPTCSGRVLEDHHLRFRSRGGTNARENRAALCVGHHKQGVHAGRVRAVGKAPHAIVVEQGLRRDGRALLTFVGGQRVG